MYPAGAVQPLSDGAAYFVQSADSNIDITATTLDTNGACSVMFWYKHNGGGSAAWAILGHTSEANSQHLRFAASDGKLKFEDNSDNEAAATLHTAFTDNQWHHYAVISTSGTVTAYQDGVSLTVGGSTLSDDLTINLIGAQYSSVTDGDTYNLDGYLCNLGVWSRACTQAEVKSIMWKGYTNLTSSESNLLTSWWALDVDGSDSTGTNNGTLA